MATSIPFSLTSSLTKALTKPTLISVSVLGYEGLKISTFILEIPLPYLQHALSALRLTQGTSAMTMQSLQSFQQLEIFPLLSLNKSMLAASAKVLGNVSLRQFPL